MPRLVGHQPETLLSESVCCKCFYGRPNTTAFKTRAADWKAFHSQRRFLSSLGFFIGPPSHLLWNLRLPVFMVMSSAVGAFVYGYCRATRWPHLPSLDSHSHTLTALYSLGSFVLAVLLGSRIKATYDRWWTARLAYGRMGNSCSQIAHLAVIWCEDPALADKIMAWLTVFQYTVSQQVLALKEVPKEALAVLGPEEAAVIAASKKGRQTAMAALRSLVAEAQLATGPFLAIEHLLAEAWNGAGSCARIKFSVSPLSLSYATTGFLMLWLILLPWSEFTGNDVLVTARMPSWLGITAFAILTLMLLSCDEIANQMEDPFPLLPLHDITKVNVGHMNRTVAEIRALRKARADEGARLATEATGAPAGSGVFSRVGASSAISVHGGRKDADVRIGPM